MICQICDKVANNNKGPDDFADLLKLRVTDTRQSFKLKNLTMPVQFDLGSEIIDGYEKKCFFTYIPLRGYFTKIHDKVSKSEFHLVMYADEVTMTNPIGIFKLFNVIYLVKVHTRTTKNS